MGGWGGDDLPGLSSALCSREVVWPQAPTPSKVASRHTWHDPWAPAAPMTFSLVTEASPSLMDITRCRYVSPPLQEDTAAPPPPPAAVCPALPTPCSPTPHSKGGVRLAVLAGEAEASLHRVGPAPGFEPQGICLTLLPVPSPLPWLQLPRRCRWPARTWMRQDVFSVLLFWKHFPGTRDPAQQTGLVAVSC